MQRLHNHERGYPGQAVEALGAGGGEVAVVHQQWLALIHLRKCGNEPLDALHVDQRTASPHNELDTLRPCREVRSTKYPLHVNRRMTHVKPKAPSITMPVSSISHLHPRNPRNPRPDNLL